jgi:four helix bundle protein
MDLAVDCYRHTQSFPKHETYGLSAQLQRAAVSIPANIAEGRSRYHTKDFLYHLSVASGSLAELETHIEIARRVNYFKAEDADRLLATCASIGRMIGSLQNSLQKKLTQG